MNNIGIFIKTCAKDHEWLKWCLLSIKKNVNKFNGLCIVTDDDHDRIDEYKDLINKLNGNITKVKQPTSLDHNCQDGIGYIWMQNIKLFWHKYCSFDAVLQLDSDCIVTNYLTPNYFIQYNKYKWFVRNWAMSKHAQVHREPLNKLMGTDSRYEHMPYSAWILTREDTVLFHEWFESKYHCTWLEHLLSVAKHDWGKDITDPVLRDMGIRKTRGSSIYNAYGGFLELTNHKNYYMVDIDETPIWHFPICQYWSWGGLSNKHVDEIQDCLSIDKTIQSLISLEEFQMFDDNFYIEQTPSAYAFLGNLSDKYSNKEKLFYHYKTINQNIKYLNAQQYENKIFGDIVVDTDFDHEFYAAMYPETKNYFNTIPYPISMRKKLYHHYINNKDLTLLYKNSIELAKELTSIRTPIPQWFKPERYEQLCPDVKAYAMPDWQHIPRAYRYYHHHINYSHYTTDFLKIAFESK